MPEVAARLNLTQSSLANLEAGAFERLPGHTFSRGYIRAYAKLLGMDQAPLVEAFDHFTGTNAKGSEVHGLGRIEEPMRLSQNLLRIVSLVLLLCVIGGGFLWWQGEYGNRREVASAPLDHVEVESADGTTQIHPIDEPETPAAQGSVTQAPVPGQVEQPVPSAPLPTPTPAVPEAHASVPAAPAAPSVPAAAQVPAPVAQAQPAAPAAVTPPAAGEGQIHIQFTADCWLQITDGNGKVVMAGLKRKGDSLDLNGKPPFQVRLGFARGAEVTYNGQAVDVKPFTSGETARVKLGQ